MYVGPAEFARGKMVVGPRLREQRSASMCDGKYHGERFFRCAAGFGQYIPLEDAEVLGEDDLLYSSPRPAPAPEPEPTRGSAQAQAPVVSPVSADRSESVVIPLGFGAGSLGGGPRLGIGAGAGI